MSKCFNDSPIKTPEDDRYGIASLSVALAPSLLGMANHVGTTVVP